jgi:hypothetical protein
VVWALECKSPTQEVVGVWVPIGEFAYEIISAGELFTICRHCLAMGELSFLGQQGPKCQSTRIEAGFIYTCLP